ncbi:NADH-quinone oxidoreductase subunit C [Bacillus sp. EB600]|uniref:NADH-quinone oxidoreductase subunit C n=1 Tax=Bacillus sp. EB600 TaxID=2806345 RepID=UPI00210B436B|nr:NADH-quinone oxidoreductase subunit C [Bacillus sp. EB600]MCQ6279898.1 NADH-quinone oxidoreductase subunit C [Bacillus sp. EB600]
MSGEKDLEQVKREAAEKAKAAALAKKQAKQSGEAAPKQEAKPTQAKEDLDAAKKASAAAAKAAALAKKASQDNPAGEAPAPAANETDLAKQKAAAAAKAKAAALAKAKAKGAEAQTEPAGDDAKAKAAAAAKAKAAAAAKAKAAAQAKTGSAESSGDDEKAKAVAAAKAKAKAAAAARAKAASGNQAEAPAAEVEEVSANQQYLDKYRKVIEENLGTDVLEDSYINKLSNDVPTLVAKRDTYFKLAQFLKYNELLSFEYLSELHGTDFGTHMEVYAHFYSYKNRQSVAIKVKIDRDEPTIESLQPIWPGANWPECEAYDLLGIKFTGHPDLHRIMLGEDWVGHPLRKDYEPYDVEV